MHHMDLHTWLQIAARRASSALEYLEEGLRAKGYWIPPIPLVDSG